MKHGRRPMVAASALVLSVMIGTHAVPNRAASAPDVLGQLQATLPAAEGELVLSSNPYDYRSLESYQALLTGGLEAVPSYVEALRQSDDNGLAEFLLTIAIEELLEMDLKREENAGATAQGWLITFDRVKRTLPEKVEAALQSHDQKAIERLWDRYGFAIYGVDSSLLADSTTRWDQCLGHRVLGEEEIQALHKVMTP